MSLFGIGPQKKVEGETVSRYFFDGLRAAREEAEREKKVQQKAAAAAQVAGKNSAPQK